MRKIPLALTINGVRHELEVEPHRTLLEVLRHDLGLTGTKENCLEGECGACTVLLGSVVVDSCILAAAACQGREIMTIEGLAETDSLHPLQQAFIDHGAVQCGYCIPGMLLAAKALLDQVPHPTPGQIREGLAGNLCRCTGYGKIVAAVRAAAQQLGG